MLVGKIAGASAEALHERSGTPRCKVHTSITNCSRSVVGVAGRSSQLTASLGQLLRISICNGGQFVVSPAFWNETSSQELGRGDVRPVPPDLRRPPALSPYAARGILSGCRSVTVMQLSGIAHRLRCRSAGGHCDAVMRATRSGGRSRSPGVAWEGSLAGGSATTCYGDLRTSQLALHPLKRCTLRSPFANCSSRA